MPTRKRNEWLDAEESDDDASGYDSEDESRAHLLPTSKRQKTAHTSPPASDDENPQYDEDADIAEPDHISQNPTDHVPLDDDEPIPTSSRPLRKPLVPPAKPKKDKSGIIYLSRCPPFMKPSVLRSLLTPYGTVGRIFLTPEPLSTRQSRLKSGGSRRKLFLDGWVEFTHKRDAKFVAQNLNAQTMGGKKRGRWHDEVWNIKYLRGVKWEHLVEQVQNENAERGARMRAEIAQGKRENARFLEDVERGKIGRTMEERRKVRGGGGDGDGDGHVAGDVGGDQDTKPERKEKGRRREFKQNEVRIKAEKKPEAGQDVQRVLGKMF
jgi:ESF2/ABP1 family protein